MLWVESDEAHGAPAPRRECCCLHVPSLSVLLLPNDLSQLGIAGGMGRHAYVSFKAMNGGREVYCALGFGAVWAR